MTRELATAAATQMGRGNLRYNRRPLAASCEHDLELLPVIDFRPAVLCRKCGGLDVEASQAIASMSPEYLILGDSTVRKLRDPPQREWGIRHSDGKVTVQVDGHAYPGCRSADKARTACDEDCEWCDGDAHVLVCRDRQPWREP